MPSRALGSFAPKRNIVFKVFHHLLYKTHKFVCPWGGPRCVLVRYGTTKTPPFLNRVVIDEQMCRFCNPSSALATSLHNRVKYSWTGREQYSITREEDFGLLNRKSLTNRIITHVQCTLGWDIGRGNKIYNFWFTFLVYWWYSIKFDNAPHTTNDDRVKPITTWEIFFGLHFDRYVFVCIPFIDICVCMPFKE